MRAGEGGRLFGSVTSQDIAAAIADQLGAKIDRRKIILDEPVKNIGRYTLNIKLHPQVQAVVHLAVVAE